VKPDQLAKLQVTVPEIARAIQQQNTVNPAGQVGGEPAGGQEFPTRCARRGACDDRRVRKHRHSRQSRRLVLRVSDVARVNSAPRRTTSAAA